MANNYYEANGILVLKSVTPVITALFGAFHLNPADPGNGSAYIAQRPEDTISWCHIHDALLILSGQLDLPCPEENDRTIQETLHLLAAYFNHSHHKELTHFIENCTFEEEADLQSLFLLATCFDDGHGLQEIRFEGCWHCSKPRLFEFGGHGIFISKEVDVIGTSSEHLIMGESLRKAILNHNTGGAADMIFASLSLLLSSIHDEAIRAAIAAQVTNRLKVM